MTLCPRCQSEAAAQGRKHLGTRRDWHYTRVPLELIDQCRDDLSSVTVPDRFQRGTTLEGGERNVGPAFVVTSLELLELGSHLGKLHQLAFGRSSWCSLDAGARKSWWNHLVQGLLAGPAVACARSQGLLDQRSEGSGTSSGIHLGGQFAIAEPDSAHEHRLEAWSAWGHFA